MKKVNLVLLGIVSLFFFLTTGCEEAHQMAEASLDYDHLNYSGPSPHPPPLGTPEVNLLYLFVEDALDFFGFLDNASAYNSGNSPDLRMVSGLPAKDDRNSKTQYFTLSEGLGYIGKGGKEKNGTTTTVTNLNYLEIPLMINYNRTISGGKQTLHAGIGPWAAVGLWGKFKSGGQSVAVKFGRKGDFNRMDYGAGFKAGLSFEKKWDISLEYDLGMRNLIGLPGNTDGDKAKTRNLSLSIGYWFK